MFYKNTVLCFVPMLYTFWGGFSGQQFMPEMTGVQIFNMVYTFLPILFLVSHREQENNHSLRCCCCCCCCCCLTLR